MSRVCTPTRRRFIRTTVAASAAAAFGAPYIARSANAKKTLRLATLAPDGSSWHQAFMDTAREVFKRTNEQLEIVIYAGGTMGDEAAMVRKMRHGQLDGGAITSVGLGEIDKQLLAPQIPMLFKDEKQLHYVRDKMSATFEGLLDGGGFKLGAWGDVGPIYIFSNTPVKTPDDLKSTKPWVWDTDPVSKAVMSVIGVNAVELGVPDVLPSLQTGLIDAFTNSPYGAIALQWYSKATYVTNLKLSFGIGGSVLTTKAWNDLDPSFQQVLTDVTKEKYGELVEKIKKANKKAIKSLKEAGITVVEPDDFMKWAAVAVQVREKLVKDGTIDAKIVNQMLEHISHAG
jgi:TRAP-type C4-dicarboxylate transport system substrate-binding protein